MSGAAELVHEETELERIENWRAQEFERAGFPPRDAATLAARFDVDLHYAVGLIERGCTHELALQILL